MESHRSPRKGIEVGKTGFAVPAPAFASLRRRLGLSRHFFQQRHSYLPISGLVQYATLYRRTHPRRGSKVRPRTAKDRAAEDGSSEPDCLGRENLFAEPAIRPQ